MLDEKYFEAGRLREEAVSKGDQNNDQRAQLQDLEREIEGVKVIVDEQSALYLVGSVLDFVDTLQESGFKIENPNASNTCGCGQSFAA